ncbi:hypothetical protein [Deinococcus sp.]|uniref:hypothetical protein n=1 Tax=Deinococcus sp. TaxID=47478 RepID=UPI0025C23BA2|nr:hypothetical protein [Deinococcus sp.]
MSLPTPQTGSKTFELDMHVNFATPLTGEAAKAALLVLEGFTVDLYRPHPKALPSGHIPHELVPSARLMGVLRDPATVRSALEALLNGSARTVEIGLRGLLRSAQGQTEWMPWRKNVVLPRHAVDQVLFVEGIKYILE